MGWWYGSWSTALRIAEGFADLFGDLFSWSGCGEGSAAPYEPAIPRLRRRRNRRKVGPRPRPNGPPHFGEGS